MRKEGGRNIMKKYYETPSAITEAIYTGDIIAISELQEYKDDNQISWADLTDGMTLS